MNRSLVAPALRCQNALKISIAFTLLCGFSFAGQTDRSNDVSARATQESQIDVNAVFTDAEFASAIAQEKGTLDSGSVPMELPSTRRVDFTNRPASFCDPSFSQTQGRNGFELRPQKTMKSTFVTLVSQRMDAESLPPTPETQVAPTPVYTMTQPTFQQVEGNAFAGPTSTGDTWVVLAPYGWIAGINGHVGVGNQAVNIDITPGDVISNLSKLDGALMLHTEVGKGNLGFILDANLIRASTSVMTAPAQVDVTLQQTMIEALGMYRLMEMPNYPFEGKPPTIDLLAGGRFYEFGNLLTVRPMDPSLPTVPLNLSATWVDMVFGARTRIPITNSIDAFGRADIGGFGIGNSSTLAWNLIAGADWKMNSCSSLIAGYRELNINKSGGVGGTAFEFNSKFYGPFMAIAFQF